MKTCISALTIAAIGLPLISSAQTTVIDWGAANDITPSLIFLQEGGGPASTPADYNTNPAPYSGDSTLNLGAFTAPPQDNGSVFNTADDYYVNRTGKTPDFYANMIGEGATVVSNFRLENNSFTGSSNDHLRFNFARAGDPQVNEGTAIAYWDASTTGLTLSSLEVSADRNANVSSGGTEEFRWIIRLGSDFYISADTGAISSAGEVRTLTDFGSVSWFTYDPVSDIRASTIGSTGQTLDFTDLSGAGFYFYGNDANRSNLVLDVERFTVQAIPEPNSLGFLLGFAALVACVRRRRQ